MTGEQATEGGQDADSLPGVSDLFSAAWEDDTGTTGGHVPPGTGGGARAVGTAPLAVRMRPRTLDELVGQDHLLAPGSPLRRLVEGAPARRGRRRSSCGARPAPARRRSPRSCRRPPSGRFVELSAVTRRGQGRPRGHGRGARRAGAATAARPCCSSTRSTASPRPSRTRCCPASRTAGSCSSPRPPRTRPSPSSRRCCRARWCSPCGRWATTTSRVLVDRAVTDPRGPRRRRHAGARTRASTSCGWPPATPAARAHRAGGGRRGRPASRSRAADRRGRSPGAAHPRARRAGGRPRGRALRPGRATSTTTWPARSSSRCAAATSTPRCTTWRGCSRRGRTRGSSPGGSIIAASEDIGMADPTALQTAVAAAQAVQLIGMPEARIILAQAVVHLALAPKSNAAYLGIERRDRRRPRRPRPARCRRTCATPLPRRAAARARQGLPLRPRRRRTASPSSSTRPTSWSAGTYYTPTGHGFERELSRLAARICAALTARPGPPDGEHGRQDGPRGERSARPAVAG